MRWLAALMVLFWAYAASGHVTELAVLKLTGIGDGRYTVSWELQPNTDRGADLEPVFPAHCVRDGAFLDCGDRDLVGPLTFEGIGTAQTAAMFKIQDALGQVQVHTVTAAQPVAKVSPTYDSNSWQGLLQIGASYVQIGFEHIMLGVDHLLFVLGLIWISRAQWMLLKTITAFTLGHSVSLAAVTLGWVGVSEIFVNVLIALSIVFIGVEVLYARAGRSTLTLRNPWAVAVFFGLLHGMGFANALLALGLPADAVPLALFAFNVGVELGQIVFVLGVLGLAWAYRVMEVRWPSWSTVLPAYAIGGLAAFWFFDRLAILMEI